METGLGCWEFGPSFGFWKDQEILCSKRTIREALKCGIRHLDTAQGYGNGLGEQILGSVLRQGSQGLQGLRGSVFLASKIMPSADDPTPMVRRSLERLSTGYLDLLYIHYPRSGFEFRPMLDKLESLMDCGLIRNIGLSNFGTSQIESLCRDHRISYIQRPVSLLWTRELTEQTDLCRSLGLKLCGYSPLGLGLLSGRYASAVDIHDARASLYCLRENSIGAFQDLLRTIRAIGDNRAVCYAWVRAKAPQVMLLGARDPGQLREDLDDLGRIRLSEDEIGELDAKAAALAASAPKDAGNLFLHNT